MFIKKITFSLIFGLCLTYGSAQTPTWAEDIAPILYAHCTSCHHTGGIGGFSFMTYAEAAVPYLDLAVATGDRSMPPWKPDPNYTHFKDENYLSQTEIDKIAAWVSGGKPQGNLVNAPTPPTYHSGSQLQQVDRTLQIPTYTIQGIDDDYRSFVIPANYASNTYLNAIEYIPGNASAVHHIVLYYDPSNYSENLDLADPAPGFASYGTGPLNGASKWIGVWAPGQSTNILPANMGFKIPPTADFVIEVHYAPGSAGQQDSSKINLMYNTLPSTSIRETFTTPILSYQNDLIDGPLFIPANTVKTFHQQKTINTIPISLIAIFPHMHKIGTAYKVFAAKNGDTTKLIDIPKWDFHWQGYYTFQKLIKILGSSTFYGVATYDNTTNNPDNPSNPPQDVSSGENTTDEMMVTFISYTNYQAGDENIILDPNLNTAISPQHVPKLSLDISPNPIQNQTTLTCELTKTGKVQARIFDTKGNLVLSQSFENQQVGTFSTPLSLAKLAAGTYYLQVLAEGKKGVQILVKE